ncbi:hypothetical protein DL771_006998 [Monosporascus sp. 5C6A]|nr:hypothetical protein DL771_006998 [Monosporascus sp. 5C6A]
MALEALMARSESKATDAPTANAENNPPPTWRQADMHVRQHDVPLEETWYDSSRTDISGPQLRGYGTTDPAVGREKRQRILRTGNEDFQLDQQLGAKIYLAMRH